jgi:endogenous inhibitor of DNA gyrase (YacG/DUF329 family)
MNKCPTCNKQVEWQNNPFRPFCSERCKLVDLGKWVNDEYRVPGKPLRDEPVDKDEEQGEASTSSEFNF